MDERKNIVGYIILGIIIVSVFVATVVLTNKEKNTDEYGRYLKNYKVNEYIPVYISDNEIAKIYLNDFLYLMSYDVERAYELLDDEYKTKKFGSLDGFINFVNSLDYESYEIDRYYKSRNGSIIGIYDVNNNLYVFKTSGVMQYKVYLDDYTVEIGD